MTIIWVIRKYGMEKAMFLSGCAHLAHLLIYFSIEESLGEQNVLKKSMINETLIMNFVGEQEELSHSIWAY